MKYNHALTINDFQNPYLLNVNLDETIIINGNRLTAEYIWSLDETQRLSLIEDIKAYYKELPTENLTDEYIDEQFNKLKKIDASEIVSESGEIKNSSSLCLDITRYFNKDNYYNVKGDSTPSVNDVFKTNLDQVLKNRMGWYTSTEDGTERPYIFNITDKMIRQGIRSSGLGFNVSQFKPVVAKYLYSKYAKEKVLDYSAGWSARALAACSLGLEYYGIDPMTADATNKILAKYGKGFCVKGGSEDVANYIDIPKVDCVLSCPPYFTLERYCEEQSQSIVKYGEYEAWLEYYWKPTVQNCIEKLKKDGYFVLVMMDKYKKYNIGQDMCDIIKNCGLLFIETLHYKTSKNHLSGKKQTKQTTKNNENIYVFKRI